MQPKPDIDYERFGAWFDYDAGIPRGAEEFEPWFDFATAERAVQFFPDYLKHTEAEWSGRPFVLSPWQANDIRVVFGWKRKDGTRLIRVVYMEIPRKNGKTELAAGVALLLLVADGEKGGQVYSMAGNKNQAKLAFDKAGVMVGFSEDLTEAVDVFKTSLFCSELMSRFEPISAVARTKHGFSPSGAVADELHEWTSGDLHDVVHKGTGARRQPLEWLITTAGVFGRGYGWEMHDRAVKIRDGDLVDPTFLPVIYAADPDDDWTLEETWRKANPNLGVSIKLDWMRHECRTAQTSPRLENDFRRYHLNQWTEQAVRWLPMTVVDDDKRNVGGWDHLDGRQSERWRDLPDLMEGRFCTGGVDLSQTRDLTALVWLFAPEDHDDPDAIWTAVPRFYVPEANVRDRVKRDRVPYDKWIAAGALKATPGNVVDYSWIYQDIKDDAERFQVGKIGVDPWNGMQFMLSLMDEGFDAVRFRQGFASMNEPSKKLEKVVIGGKLEHGAHPVLRWCATNVAVETDPAGNIKPSKVKSSERIDGVVGLVEAVGVALVGDQEQYVEDEVLVL